MKRVWVFISLVTSSSLTTQFTTSVTPVPYGTRVRCSVSMHRVVVSRVSVSNSLLWLIQCGGNTVSFIHYVVWRQCR